MPRPTSPEANKDGYNGRSDSSSDAGIDINEQDVEKRLDLEKADNSRDTSHCGSPCPSIHESIGKTVVSFAENDPSNPYNWSLAKKVYVTVSCIVLVLNSTIGSSLSSGATAETQRFFDIQGQELLVLPVSIYLIGYVLGPLLFAPLSESFGRRIVMISTFVMFTAFTLGCALAPTFAGLVVFRLLTGIGASTPISVIGGIYADIYRTPKARGLVITLFMAATSWGPLIGPVISGFVSPVSWRWTYWAALIIAGATWPLLLFTPETYGPIILKKKAQKLRKETGDLNIVAPIELQKTDLKQLVTVVLTRPIRMLYSELIVMTTCLYLSVVYGIFYIYFQAYPIVFEGIYGFNAGEEGLTFLPIGIGAAIAASLYLVWDSFVARSKAKTPPARWTQIEEYRRLPLACIGGPLFVVGLFWLGWTARPDIHWIVPVLSALPFGIGYLLIFMGELNYLVDAYEVFAASALGIASCTRSIFAVVLPFAAKPLYDNLGVPWACSLLGFLSLVMTLVPFVFIKYGDKIRAGSKLCQELRQNKANEEREAVRRQERSGNPPGNFEDPEKQV